MKLAQRWNWWRERRRFHSQIKLLTRCRVEAGAEIDQAFDDFTGRVGLHGIVDARMTQAGLQGVVLLFDAVDIQHKGRTVEGVCTDEGFDAGRACNSTARRKIGYVSVHGHLQ